MTRILSRTPSPRRRPRARRAQAGFLLIEVLVAVVILLVALLGTAGLVARSGQTEMESYQRVQALALLQDMAARLNANRQVAACYANGAAGMQLGSAAAPPAACTQGSAAQNATANADLQAWNAALLGSAEMRPGASAADPAQAVGAMIGARGCIETVDAINQVYRITVAWQGLATTGAPALACGKDQYGNDAYRRAVSTQIRIGTLGTVS
ncbi:type IV pilus modification protein PilV [Cupriavidus taiwanensis]|uniref:type IV pilus modification protein PilV n=1 Tax=Cupriavidus taiwanensis TaxID=164546 RepID=UPI002540F88F|nr:type IV pilus modification protein PilV [Cupriavidus taiwanensis]MDK3024014.1 type IV pilus modification protein PilV [Cupriavidus taiwanensis]